MELILPTAAQTEPILRALKTVASADGSFAEPERAMLEAAQEIFGSSHDLAALAPISPEALAAAIPDPELRKQLVNGMVVASMVDENVTPAEVAQCEVFAAALGVTTDELHNLRQIVEGHTLRIKLDVARRVWL